MTYYIKRGTAYFPSTHTEVLDHLPLGTYQVMFNPDAGYFLEVMDNLTSGTDKLYGDTDERADRILDTAVDRKLNTGVLLTGEKGSGKSLLARVVSAKARDRGISTLVVNSPYGGELFNQLLESIEQPLMIMFDEFDKVYDEHKKQTPLLSLFDGVAAPSDHLRLYMVTMNELYLISSYMMNRPGRFYYHYQFDTLEEQFVREYLEDRLDDKSKVDGVVRFTKAFHKLNFDMLKAVVEEMNRYREGPNEVIRHLNVTPYSDGGSAHWEVESWDLKVKPKGLKVAACSTYGGSIDPLNKTFYVYFGDGKPDSDTDDHQVRFDPDDVVSFTGGKLVLSNQAADITLVKKQKHQRLMDF